MAYYIKNRLQSTAPTQKGNLSELHLFSEMMQAFHDYYNATVIIDETHHKLVDFDTSDPYTGVGTSTTKEISDLHIISYSPMRLIARETYLQAKVARDHDGLQPNGDFTFHGDWFQYDLLSRRPLVYPSHKGSIYRRSYCHTFLQDAILPSIGSYGIFYKDRNGTVDFAYQPANLLQLTTLRGKYKGFYNMQTKITPIGYPKGIPDLCYTHKVDDFEDAVIHNLVGSPLVVHKHHIDYPYWWFEALWYRISRNKRNSEQQLKHTLLGLQDFNKFILKNLEILIRDGEPESETLERYRHIEGYDLQDGVKTKSHANDISHGDYDRENYGFCHGPISLVLINTDNCK